MGRYKNTNDVHGKRYRGNIYTCLYMYTEDIDRTILKYLRVGIWGISLYNWQDIYK